MVLLVVASNAAPKLYFLVYQGLAIKCKQMMPIKNVPIFSPMVV